MASIIDRTLAKSLIENYKQQNATAGGSALLTPDEQLLNGYFIDRASLDAILSNPVFVGLNVHLAKHPDFPDSEKNIITIVFAGAQPNPDYNGSNGVAPYLNSGDLYELVGACPPFCGGL
ncbi:hypothetical protein [Mucilaginibacter sp.]|uniref:hypothetical protein n=1 Tax=Mucilaginibacter sp. TaxID=1882438 RepID=UPI003D0AAC31